jgi:carbon storage regulator CsrA
MLVLSRKVGQEIVIGEAVVRIEKVVGNKVSISIAAPAEVKILRKELLEKGQRDN